MGRPPKPPTPGELAPLSVRITAALKARLQAVADEAGRSISAEVESRLEDSFNKAEAEAMMKEVREIRAEFREKTKAQVEEIKELMAALLTKAVR